MSMDIIDRIAAALDNAHADGRTPSRLLIGNLEATELEAALYRSAKTEYGLFDEVLFEVEEMAPKFPLVGMERCTLFGVPVERVDQESLVGVISEAGVPAPRAPVPMMRWYCGRTEG